VGSNPTLSAITPFLFFTELLRFDGSTEDSDSAGLSFSRPWNSRAFAAIANRCRPFCEEFLIEGEAVAVVPE
jgi:hypothetical protein